MAGRSTLVALAATGLLLSACSTEESTDSNKSDSTVTNAEGSGAASEEKEQSAPEETAGPSPRLVATYDGGILTLDAKTLKVIDDTKIEGFNRLNPVGDGRTVLVSTKDGFQVFDAGAWTEPHGDHTHSYVTEPKLTNTTYKAEKPGHVVPHGDSVLLFGDGDGSIQELKISDFPNAYREDKQPEVVEKHEVTPHHGVAIALKDGKILRTDGNEDERHTVVVQDKNDKILTKTDQCPGVHGEAAAKDAIGVGCENGIVIYKDGKFTKVNAPDKYGRIGNQAGSKVSPVILGDYKVDKDAELERPTRISLTNTDTDQLKLVDVEASYSFRSLGRAPEGEALVLGTDGNLRKIDPNTGQIIGKYKVTDEWRESETWQDPRPTLFVLGKYAYVSEPDAQKLHKVDIATGKVVKTVDTPDALNELTGVTG
ncbi:hypothetical protein GSS87_09210 [Corynebacterium sp. 4HC-13]|uniref:zinc metallochaperone AztD n=1 Tax=Corynebacterium anserum TaxID=2684406 RepID=UPI00163A539C|nr:zinc metallochaperone AztD [Corynebacterium anserum]MBC2682561.1 hypothetical protein [Corynebacterium anserum]